MGDAGEARDGDKDVAKWRGENPKWEDLNVEVRRMVLAFAEQRLADFDVKIRTAKLELSSAHERADRFRIANEVSVQHATMQGLRAAICKLKQFMPSPPKPPPDETP